MNHIQIKQASDCCGCGACFQKCPKKCITMCYDKEGFLYPHVDESKCSECGLCISTCHLLKADYNPNDSKVISCYGGYSKSDDIIESSSGGVFWLLSQQILKVGGVIYGAVVEGFKVYHSRGDSLKECERFRKSKYLQSDTKETYKEAQTDLKAGRMVLYSGTPCQIAGLYSFLGKLYDNLITCEVICHGVPSKAAFDKWLEELAIKHNGNKPVSVVWRDKSQGWSPVRLTYYFEDGSKWTSVQEENLFQRGFVNYLYLRPSCYSCKYARLPRVADVTLADFWRNSTSLKVSNENKGINIVILSSEKACKLFETIKDEMVYEMDNIEHIVASCPHVSKKPFNNPKRKSFFKLLRSHSFEKAIHKTLDPSFCSRVKNYLIRKIKLIV